MKIRQIAYQRSTIERECNIQSPYPT